MTQEYSLRQEEKALDVIAIGNINVDLTAVVDKIPEEDSEVEAKSFSINFGGSAANFAVAASRLGLKTGIIAWVGSDVFGDLSLQDLMKEGVDVSRVKYSDLMPTGSVTVLVSPDGSRRMIAFRGANKLLSADDLDEKYLSRATLVHASNVSINLASEIAAKARKLGIKFSYDPGGLGVQADKDALEKIFSDTDILFCNKVEAHTIVGSDDVEKCAEHLSNLADIVVVKMGKEGALIRSGKMLHKVPAFKVNVVDTTGAGDAFNAGFILGLLKDQPLDVAGLIANATAALKITKAGARQGLPTLSQVKKFLESNGLSLEI